MFLKGKANGVQTVLLALIFSSCASIVSKSSYPIVINSKPASATVKITDGKGRSVFQGTTPATLSLKSGQSYFKRASYQVHFSLEGYDDRVVPLNCKIDGWYFGNLIFGGGLGLLIIDPATGAMYKLETDILVETLSKSTASLEEKELRILDVNNIPQEWKSHLILLGD
ncbi:hypothetical protein [Fulvivirga lutimaris]|uniref:hypothetical protein n=1 Tax=Fulvivirga lutimaris TaxID=1819566 RepID=UPI0012BD5460|nr:hypothetical protein [Fulvivirga lutimaris]MTI38441.1 hypothetical protein [Fulvivirga lutimaris]